VTDRERLVAELRPVAIAYRMLSASPRARTWYIKRCSGCVRHLMPGEKIAALGFVAT
jgi:hypothetical protein